jgi:hypothetical protein
MKNILVVLLLTIASFATSSRFVHYDGLGSSVDQAVDNGHTNLRMMCTGDTDSDQGNVIIIDGKSYPAHDLTNVTVVKITNPSRYDHYYHAEMTATCSSKD